MKPPRQLTTRRIGPTWEVQRLTGEQWRLGVHVTRQERPVTKFRDDAYRVRWWNYAIIVKLGRRRIILWHFVEDANGEA